MSNAKLLSAGISAILGKNVVLRSGGRYSVHDLLKKVPTDDRTLRGSSHQSGLTTGQILMMHEDPGVSQLITETFDSNNLDPKFDYDFTDLKDEGKKFMRGEFEYKRPYGWKRFAVRVLDKYEDDEWLGPDGIRTDQAPGEWPVAYHGTYMDSARMIVKEGYKPGPGDAHGKGIYSSPSLEMVERYYAKEFELKGKRYKIALQNRVNPDQGAGRLEITAASVTGTGADYWLSPEHNDDVRPYGILIREVPQSTF